MKKGLFFLAFALLGISSFAQNLNKGNLIGLHNTTIDLKPGVTMGDYVKFFTTKVIPAYDKAFPGMKTYLIKSVRGQDSSSMGVIFMFNSEADRNKYFKNDGTPTELFTKANAKLDAISKEMDQYVKSSNTPDKYNDWVVK
ncbi:MAG: hypothetical protein C5B59_06245 [Bacteroidetes bacterium]|nr:MAG: hypothetical protein C5B59_06245 [Bacteroidota bacterium]